MRTIFILHNIRSAQNVGSIFRTADAAGVDRIILTGYTPAPLDKFKRTNSKIAKTALGAEKAVPWEHTPDIYETIARLQEEDTAIIAVEQNGRAIGYRDFASQKDTAFLFGNEVEGLAYDILENTDEIIEIPMRGEKESLNVSVAAGIIAYHFLD